MSKSNTTKVDGKTYHIEPNGEVTFIRSIQTEKLPAVFSKGINGLPTEEIKVEKTQIYKDMAVNQMKSGVKKDLSNKIKFGKNKIITDLENTKNDSDNETSSKRIKVIRKPTHLEIDDL